MTELLTAAQMRAIEQAAIDAGMVTGLELMERAGRGVVAAIYEEWPEFSAGGEDERAYLDRKEEGAAARRAVVLCGPGNNGGDGFVVARLLAEDGWAVEVFLYGNAERLPPDARVNYDRWCEANEVLSLTDESFDGYLEENKDVVLYVDALFGTGLSRPFLSLSLVQMEWIYAHALGRVAAVAIDVPSGLCSDSGHFLGYEDENPTDVCMFANLTVTFHSRKPGHLLADGPSACGVLRVVDIGLQSASVGPSISRDALSQLHAPGITKVQLGRYVANEVTEGNLSPYLQKEADEHKYDHGHALVLTGGAGRTGAARLAARGALRVGAGLVTLGVPGAAQMEVACHTTSEMLMRFDDGDALANALEDPRINALCMGPGLGVGDREADLVRVALENTGPDVRRVVLDADALTLISRSTELFDALHEGCVLTPHGGEFARLFPDIAEKLKARSTKGPAYSKVDATREAAARAGCMVLFKGPDTVIASPQGICAIHAAVHDRVVPWLATAGAGDVLAGFIAGLLARGLEAQKAAEAAAWLHVECARSFGPGLIAEDLPEELPKVLRALFASGDGGA